ncbi:MAG: hypothetical protein Q8P22_05805 [Chloroflexota bacterium]|nr:hypothetical protein [Chloroflexota bacterium]
MTTRNDNVTTNPQGPWRFWWGASPLPDGAEPLGTVTRDGHDTGALLRLRSGQLVQGNVRSLRTLPPGPIPVDYGHGGSGHAH